MSNYDLETMSDAALATLEDQLLLENELDLSKNAQLSVGRVVVFVLSIVFIVILMALYSRLPTEKLGPLNIPLYLGCLAGGAILGHLTWQHAGQGVRTVTRWVVGNWPVLLVIVVQLKRLF